MTKLSIIIPTLNEAKNIHALLEYLQTHSSSENIEEIIVVDGGSSDETIDLASSVPGVQVLKCDKGRSKQMNHGARHAIGEILYFLHADSFPPQAFDDLIIREYEKGNQAGCFRLKFDDSHWWLRLAGWLTRFNWRACRGGDQSQFIGKTLFQELGGFDEQMTILEDNDLINKLYDRQAFVVIQKNVLTSARCYRKHGIWTLQYHFWTLYIKKWLGASPEELRRYYEKKIA